MRHFADRVLDAVKRKKTPAVVGIDPHPDLLPNVLRSKHALGRSASPTAWAKAVEEFCSRALDVVGPLVPAVKFQSAFFELHGSAGVRSLEHLIAKARRLGLITILDAKRGDIGSTSEAYAQAAFGVPPAPDPRPAAASAPPAPSNSALTDRAGADALTVHPYLGRDSLQPFLDRAQAAAGGLFVLVRTSNPGARDLQELPEARGGKPIYRTVASWVDEWSAATCGTSGYGSVGAVVGATAGAEVAELRRAMPHALLLIPGYGAQGASASDVAAAMDDRGLGALINSSRAVLFPSPANPNDVTQPWEAAIERAVRAMIADLAQHTPAGKLAGR